MTNLQTISIQTISRGGTPNAPTTGQNFYLIIDNNKKRQIINSKINYILRQNTTLNKQPNKKTKAQSIQFEPLLGVHKILYKLFQNSVLYTPTVYYF